MVVIYFKNQSDLSRPCGFSSLPSGFPHILLCVKRHITSYSQWPHRKNERRQRPLHHPSLPSPHPHLRQSSRRSSALPVSAMTTWTTSSRELHQAQNPVRVSTAHYAGRRRRDYLSVAIGGYQLGHDFGPSRIFEQVSARRSLCANKITTSLHE